MRTIAKLAHAADRSPFSGLLDHVRRALSLTGERRQFRPLQDVDVWSDQAEVAYYEDCRAGRC